jgi:hypothetical protein
MDMGISRQIRENDQHIKISVHQLMRKYSVINLGMGNLPAWYILFQGRAKTLMSQHWTLKFLITFPNEWNFTYVRNQS